MMTHYKKYAVLFIVVVPIIACAQLIQHHQDTQLEQQISHWLANPTIELNDFESPLPGTLVTKAYIESGVEIAVKDNGAQCIAYAPHRFYDKYTYTIAEHLFNQHCNAFVTNTVHRNTLTKAGMKTDLGKYPHSVATRFISQYATKYGAVKVYQIHGFASSKRRTAVGKKADVILSHGRKKPTKHLYQISECLSQTLQLNALVYPFQVTELGGTKNVLNRELPERSEFFHIELSDKTRLRLIEHPSLINKFNLCITL